MPFKDEPLSSDLQCWGYEHGGIEEDSIPRDVHDPTPYPGYAGEDSENAAKNGSQIPLIPKAVDHGSHERKDF